MTQKFFWTITALYIIGQVGAGVAGYYYGKESGRGSLSCNKDGQLIGTNVDFHNTSVQFFGSGDNASEQIRFVLCRNLNANVAKRIG